MLALCACVCVRSRLSVASDPRRNSLSMQWGNSLAISHRELRVRVRRVGGCWLCWRAVVVLQFILTREHEVTAMRPPQSLLRGWGRERERENASPLREILSHSGRAQRGAIESSSVRAAKRSQFVSGLSSGWVETQAHPTRISSVRPQCERVCPSVGGYYCVCACVCV